ncbi:holo-ACP synthase [Virgibacillus flavescens]|uniref:holo-ACP synthase n=1 Tax=Virgibacillus flavescens TaxID=1611422 RepID=UPI003D34E255
MIKGIGIDIIEIDRIRKSIEKNSRLVNRVLTPEEQIVYQDLKSQSRQIEFLAGRFAAKEAFGKAAGTGIGKLSFQDIHVAANENGAPSIVVEGYHTRHIFISISHSKDYAVAQVIIEE